MRSAVLSLLFLLAASPAHAKDLGNRVGVGVQTQLGAVPALSARYGLPTANPAVNVQVEADFGIATTDAGTALYVGGRGLYAVVVEDNMNLYAYAAVGYNDDGTGGVARVQPGLEAQAFLFGLENLGITASFGANIDAGEQTGFSTAGAVAAGLHYWF